MALFPVSYVDIHSLQIIDKRIENSDQKDKDRIDVVTIYPDG
jgi:hypothetical protein